MRKNEKMERRRMKEINEEETNYKQSRESVNFGSDVSIN